MRSSTRGAYLQRYLRNEQAVFRKAHTGNDIIILQPHGIVLHKVNMQETATRRYIGFKIYGDQTRIGGDKQSGGEPVFTITDKF